MSDLKETLERGTAACENIHDLADKARALRSENTTLLNNDKILKLHLSAAVDENAKLRSQLVKARTDAIIECMSAIDNLRASGAGLFDAKHSGQRGVDRSDALFDAHELLRKLCKQTDDNGK